MLEDFSVTLDRIDHRGGERTPAFGARLLLNGWYVASIESDGLGGPPILQWIDPRGRDAELLRCWRIYCDHEADRIYRAALGSAFPVCRDHDGVDWAAEELVIFTLYSGFQRQVATERATAMEHWKRQGRRPL